MQVCCNYCHTDFVDRGLLLSHTKCKSCIIDDQERKTNKGFCSLLRTPVKNGCILTTKDKTKWSNFKSEVQIVWKLFGYIHK